nr:hypothetical protein Iba_chr12aCG2120 [Ipomoea batatas]
MDIGPKASNTMTLGSKAKKTPCFLHVDIVFHPCAFMHQEAISPSSNSSSAGKVSLKSAQFPPLRYFSSANEPPKSRLPSGLASAKSSAAYESINFGSNSNAMLSRKAKSMSLDSSALEHISKTGVAPWSPLMTSTDSLRCCSSVPFSSSSILAWCMRSETRGSEESPSSISSSLNVTPLEKEELCPPAIGRTSKTFERERKPELRIPTKLEVIVELGDGNDVVEGLLSGATGPLLVSFDARKTASPAKASRALVFPWLQFALFALSCSLRFLSRLSCFSCLVLHSPSKRV